MHTGDLISQIAKTNRGVTKDAFFHANFFFSCPFHISVGIME